MNTDQASAALGIGQNAILDAIKRGTLPAEKVGRSWEISEEEVERYRVEHRGRQGRVSKEQAQERAHKAAQTARRNRAEGKVTPEDQATVGQLLQELAEARRELRETRQPRHQPDPAPVATLITPATDIMAQDELVRLVRKAEVVVLRLEAIAARLEVSTGQ